MAKRRIFIDVTKCSACRGCQTACKNWNNLPADIKPFKGNLQTHERLTPNTFTYVTMEEKGAGKDFKWLFRKHQCLHCTEATCVKVCPKGALKHTETGSVVRDYDKCIGCGYCATNCPFGVPQIDAKEEKMYKCTQCSDRISNGLIPMCAKTCPTGAITFGEEKEILAMATGRLDEIKKDNPKANLYGTDFLGGTATFYLLAAEPETYGLPKNPAVPTSVTVWKDLIQPIGKFLPFGALGAVALSYAYNKLIAGKQDAEHAEKGGMSHGK